MQIRIKYFGMLTDITGREEESLYTEQEDVEGLLQELYGKYPQLRNKQFKVALNETMVSNYTKLSYGELALLPPFSGG